MSEMLPAVIERRWTRELPLRAPARVLSMRYCVLLTLSAILVTIAGAAAAAFAWWQPLTQPSCLVMALTHPSSTSPLRRLAMDQDVQAIVATSDTSLLKFNYDRSLSERELRHYLSALQLSSSRSRVFVYLTVTADVTPQGEVVFYCADVGPDEPGDAFRMAELIDAIEACGADATFVALDVVPIDSLDAALPPAPNLSEQVAAELESAKLSKSQFLLSCTTGQYPNLYPAAGRTVFGWLVEQSLRGAADGAGPNGKRDGRVTVAETIAFVQQETPRWTWMLTNTQQAPRVFGRGQSFELSTVKQTALVAPLADKPRQYPTELLTAWAQFEQAANGALQGRDSDSMMRWARTLQTEETKALFGPALPLPDPPPAKPATSKSTDQQKKSSAGDRKHANGGTAKSDTATSAAPTPDSAVAAPLEFATALTEYLAQRVDTAATVTPAQLPAARKKLLADFAKAHATCPSDVVTQNILQTALSANHQTLEDWKSLVEMLGAFPVAHSTPESDLLRQLVALRANSEESAMLTACCVQALRLSQTTAELVEDRTTWPWTQQQLVQLLERRVHAEALLFARGYASLADASAELSDASEDAEVLAKLNAVLGRARQLSATTEMNLRSMAGLATTDANLCEAWQNGVRAFDALLTSLQPPAEPPADLPTFRRLVENIARDGASLESALTTLEASLASPLIAELARRCQSDAASAQDMLRARFLLACTALAASDRELLWNAYASLAICRQKAALAGNCPDLPVTDLISATQFDAHCRQMAQAWQAMKAKQAALRSQASVPESPANAQMWLDDWRRYRSEQLARIHAAVSGAASQTSPVWSASLVDIPGPLVCDALSPKSPCQTFGFPWFPRDSAIATCELSAYSPSAQLLAVPLTREIRAGQPAQFQLTLQRSTSPQIKPVRGVLAEVRVGGRSFLAPIELPALEHVNGVAILLSSTPETITPLEHTVALAGARTDVYVFAENLTGVAQDLQLNIAGGPSNVALKLAPHEIQRVPFAKVDANDAGPRTDLTVSVSDAASQHILATRTLPLSTARIANCMRVVEAWLSNDPRQGPVANLHVVAATPTVLGNVVTLDVVRLPYGESLSVARGQTRGALEAAPLQLSAFVPNATPGQRLRCQLWLEGIAEPLLVEGLVPGPGDSEKLVVVTSPVLTLQGLEVSAPMSQYQLQLDSAGVPKDGVVVLELCASDSAESPLLSRRLPALPLPQATLAATAPPGGLALVANLTSPPQVFDTTGLMGRFQWRAKLLDVAGQTLATAERALVLDGTPPIACRFVRPPLEAAKGSQVTLSAFGREDLTDIASVRFFVGLPEKNAVPPTAKTVSATRDSDDALVWSAPLALPSDLGSCDVTAEITNTAGLTTFVSTSILIMAEAPLPTGQIRGVLLEGTRPQGGLAVSLMQAGHKVAQTKTAADGSFHFSNLQPGEYEVTSLKPDSGRHGQHNAQVKAGETAAVEVRLAL
jgi:hypothetical protein